VETFPDDGLVSKTDDSSSEAFRCLFVYFIKLLLFAFLNLDVLAFPRIVYSTLAWKAPEWAQAAAEGEAEADCRYGR
jgi:hypothetical protein